jgi:hypothetical protein
MQPLARCWVPVAVTMAAIVALGAPVPVRAAAALPAGAATPSFSAERLAKFGEALAPHGAWLDLGGDGRVWRPNDVGPDWRPYYYGSWTWTQDGWFWVSDEPWGWVTYHYGRWYFHGQHGWVWVPGVTWAPAWVTWRWNDDIAGWAALPPRGSPLAAFWTFVPTSRLVGERVEAVAFPATKVPALFARTRPGRASERPTRPGRAAAPLIAGASSSAEPSTLALTQGRP